MNPKNIGLAALAVNGFTSLELVERGTLRPLCITGDGEIDYSDEAGFDPAVIANDIYGEDEESWYRSAKGMVDGYWFHGYRATVCFGLGDFIGDDAHCVYAVSLC